MSDFFETKVKNLELKEDKNFSAAAKKPNMKNIKKRKQEDSDPSVVESSEESFAGHHPKRKHYILHGKCCHSTDSCKDLRAMINKNKQKKKKINKFYIEFNKELNALIDKTCKKFGQEQGEKQK